MNARLNYPMCLAEERAWGTEDFPTVSHSLAQAHSFKRLLKQDFWKGKFI